MTRLNRREFIVASGATVAVVCAGPTWSSATPIEPPILDVVPLGLLPIERMTSNVNGTQRVFGWRRIDREQRLELAPLGDVVATWPGAEYVPRGVIQLTDGRTGSRRFGYEDVDRGCLDDAIQREFGDAVFQELLEEIRRRGSAAAH